VKIDIWTDLVCPFCALGRARFEQALERFEHRDQVEIQWHAFELDRNAEPVSNHDLPGLIAAKYGTSREQSVAQHESLARQFGDVGLAFNWNDVKHGNTFDAHRVVALAAEVGAESGDAGLAGRVHAGLMKAYFADGVAIGSRDALVALARSLGLDADAVRNMLESDDYGNHVRSDEATAKMLNITGVPFFVLDRRYGVSGAQPVETFEEALAQAWATRNDEREPAMAGCGCGDGGCGNAACGGGVCAS
jgi:predicted DsbA family dithiol-disulfide isomerase